MSRKLVVEKNDRESVIKIFASKETLNHIVELLARKNRKSCHYEIRHSITSAASTALSNLSRPHSTQLMLDYRAIRLLLDDGELEKDIKNEIVQFLFDDAEVSEDKKEEMHGEDDKIREARNICLGKALEEEKLYTILDEISKRKRYNFTQRIWVDDNDGRKYYTKVNGDIYFTEDLNILVDLINDVYLIESEKSPIDLALNPLKPSSYARVFGVFDVVWKFANGSKSVFHITKKGQIKKKYDTLVKEKDPFPILFDGAIATGLPARTSFAMQSLIIWPLFIRTGYNDYLGAQYEAKRVDSEYRQALVSTAELQADLANFRSQLCGIVWHIDGVDEKTTPKLEAKGIKDINKLTPQELIKNVIEELHETVGMHNSENEGALKAREELVGKVVVLCNNYEQLISEKHKIPNYKDFAAAYFASLVTGGILLASGVCNVGSFLGMCGVFDSWIAQQTSMPVGFHTTPVTPIINYGGPIGQSVLTLYAFYKTSVERRSWKEVTAELEKFRDATDVSKIAHEITTKILKAKKSHHQAQTIGSLIWALGQLASTCVNTEVAVATGGTSVGASPFLILPGLVLTTMGVVINEASRRIYEKRYPVDNQKDEIANKLLGKSPEITDPRELQDLNQVIKDHSRRQIFALELLGHLREPQVLLYDKYLKGHEKKSNQDNKLSKEADKLTKIGGVITKNSHTHKLIEDMARELASHPEELDIAFDIESDDDIDFIWQLSNKFCALHALRVREVNDYSVEKEVERIVDEIWNLVANYYVLDSSKKFRMNLLNCEDIDEVHEKLIKAIQHEFVDARKRQHQHVKHSTKLKKEEEKKVEEKKDEEVFGAEEALEIVAEAESEESEEIEEPGEVTPRYPSELLTPRNTLQDPVIRLCKSILSRNNKGAVYLKKKLLRAVANGDLKYGNDEEVIEEVRSFSTKPMARVNHAVKSKIYQGTKFMIPKKAQPYLRPEKEQVVRIVKFDIERFDPIELKKFLIKGRHTKNLGKARRLAGGAAELFKNNSEEIVDAKNPPQNSLKKKAFKFLKGISLPQKKTVLKRAVEEEFPHVKSHYLNPFKKISKISQASRPFNYVGNKKNRSKNNQEIKQERKHFKIGKDKKSASPSLAVEETEDKNSEKKWQDWRESRKFRKSRKVAPQRMPETIHTKREQKQEEVREQNEMIDRATENTRSYQLKFPPIIDYDKDTTTFVYASPTHPDSADHEIIYVRDNKTQKITTIFGDAARAIIPEKANQKANAAVLKISGGKVERFGDTTKSDFKTVKPKSATASSLPKSSPTKPLRGMAAEDDYKSRNRTKT